MPELPEVESLRLILTKTIVGRVICDVKLVSSNLRRPVTSNLNKLVAGQEIRAINRRGKYLLVQFDKGVLLIHLGMTGSLTHRTPETLAWRPEDRTVRPTSSETLPLKPVHDHVRFRLDDGSELVYNDPRRFGLLKFVANAQVDTIEELSSLGPEPLDAQFDHVYLASKLRSRKAPIKSVLMDQTVVAGLGNIYASEALFAASIRPTRRARSLKLQEVMRLIEAIRSVLAEAIEAGGTTFRNYLDSQGRPGRFASKLRVYGRDGEACYRCGATVRRVIIGQRASFFCPGCQR